MTRTRGRWRTTAGKMAQALEDGEDEEVSGGRRMLSRSEACMEWLGRWLEVEKVARRPHAYEAQEDGEGRGKLWELTEVVGSCCGGPEDGGGRKKLLRGQRKLPPEEDGD
ncbi:hypothetical protein FNV43_RR14962 [Rhamnella rubrinervis]|uniref:Uncharacterized protein n=1 Tax=Rhamnella rubrinervis TaxID=2594499 RepID=A0A8K0MGX8_9ROSA|nr:hypothetical protein FNV43_RR14962 [Rhamnella rubrinervis]